MRELSDLVIFASFFLYSCRTRVMDVILVTVMGVRIYLAPFTFPLQFTPFVLLFWSLLSPFVFPPFIRVFGLSSPSSRALSKVSRSVSHSVSQPPIPSVSLLHFVSRLVASVPLSSAALLTLAVPFLSHHLAYSHHATPSR